MKYRIQDSFDTTASRYWGVFFDEEYCSALFRHIDIDWQLLELEREGDGEDLVIRRTQRLTPRREIPRVMRKFVEGAIAYTEYDVFTARNNSMQVRTVPSFLSEKVKTHGIYSLEILDPSRVNRIFDAECTCKLPLVGGTIERHIVDEVKESYRRTTAFTRTWLQKYPA
jgi:hypothetical protein